MPRRCSTSSIPAIASSLAGRRGTAAHRAQDHRRHLRRLEPAWRRRVQRQGSFQGRPLGELCARHIAKHVVAAGVGRRGRGANRLCHRRRRGGVGPGGDLRTAKVDEDRIARAVRATFPLTPRGMIEALDLSPTPVPQDRRLRALAVREDEGFTWGDSRSPRAAESRV